VPFHFERAIRVRQLESIASTGLAVAQAAPNCAAQG